MKNRILDFETCRQLKDAGFDEPTTHFYRQESPDQPLRAADFYVKNSDLSNKEFCIPSISQVLDWAWYDHVSSLQILVNNNKSFNYKIISFNKNSVMRIDEAGPFNDRCESEVAAIKKFLKNLVGIFTMIFMFIGCTPDKKVEPKEKSIKEEIDSLDTMKPFATTAYPYDTPQLCPKSKYKTTVTDSNFR